MFEHSYFSLTRLLGYFFGHAAERSEMNYFEANLVGIFVHLVAFVFGFHLLLSGHAIWQQLLLLLPLAVLVWIFWLLYFYFSSLLIRWLRAIGLMRALSDGRAQSITVGIVTTIFAFTLIGASHFSQIIGMIWLAAVALNLLAAIVLAFVDVSAAE